MRCIRFTRTMRLVLSSYERHVFIMYKIKLYRPKRNVCSAILYTNAARKHNKDLNFVVEWQVPSVLKSRNMRFLHKFETCKGASLQEYRGDLNSKGWVFFFFFGWEWESHDGMMGACWAVSDFWGQCQIWNCNTFIHYIVNSSEDKCWLLHSPTPCCSSVHWILYYPLNSQLSLKHLN